MSGLIMQPESIAAIIAGKKIQTHRLVKEGEVIILDNRNGGAAGEWFDKILKLYNFPAVFTGKGRAKWQVGKTYFVNQNKKGQYCLSIKQTKKTVWYCPSCKKLRDEIACAMNSKKELHCIDCLSSERNTESCLKPLRVRLLSIRSENLLDISEEDAKCEGAPFPDFPSPSRQVSFIYEFHKINKLKLTTDGAFQNPKVWVLAFSIAGGEE